MMAPLSGWLLRSGSAAGLAVVLNGIVAVPIGHGAAARSSVESDFQDWSELDVSAQLTDRLNLTWVSQGRVSADLRNPAAYSSGLDVNIGAGNRLTITPSYYYIAYYTATGQLGRIQTPILAATLAETSAKWNFSDRSRFVGALGRPESFWIFQTRPRLEYQLGPNSWGTSVFAWDEVSYYSIFGKWTRNRAAAGAHLVISERWGADLYYLRQDDSRSLPRSLNGLGVTLQVRAWP